MKFDKISQCRSLIVLQMLTLQSAQCRLETLPSIRQKSLLFRFGGVQAWGVALCVGQQWLLSPFEQRKHDKDNDDLGRVPIIAEQEEEILEQNCVLKQNFFWYNDLLIKY